MLILVSLLSILFGVFFRPFVITKLWFWFVMPLSATLPALSYWAAWGFSIFVTFLTFTPNLTDAPKEPSDEAKTAGRVVSYGIIYPLVALGVGALVHSCR